MKETGEKKRPGRKTAIRKLRRRDRDRIGALVASSGKFNDIETATALELVDEALENGERSGYIFAVLADEKDPALVHGYACYGPAPLTQGTWDLYWIVIERTAQKKGLGRSLLEYVERDVIKRKGRMLLVETSSQESYRDTIRFYKSRGYHLEARVKNFYRAGDDKLIFQKELA